MPADRRQVLTLAAPVLWTAFLLLPAEGWGHLDGVPIRPIEAAVLSAVWWIWYVRRAIPGGAWLPMALAGVKLVAGVALVAHGFNASYFANASWMPPHERSLEFRAGPFTRQDGRLAFTAPDGPELPLHFFHDNGRFNVGTTAERDRLPFSVIWDGYWRVRAPATPRIYLEGQWLEAALLLDGAVVLEKAGDVVARDAKVPLAAGWRHVVVRVSAPGGMARAFEAGTLDADGTREPLGSRDVFPAPVEREARERDARARAAGSLVDGGVVALVGFWTVLALTAVLRTMRQRTPGPAAGRGGALFALAILIALADAWWFARQVEHRLLLLLGGDDMLTYATLARDIALDGPLMLGGQPLGQAAPFYYQPLYPYVVAFTHVVFGEDGFGIFLVQRLGVWATLLAVWRIGTRLFGRRAGWATLAMAVVFLAARVLPWSRVLLGENIFIPLLGVCAWAMVALAQGGAVPAGIAAGVTGGLATLSRSTLLPAWAAVLPIAGVARRRTGLGLGPVVLAGLLVVAVTGLATARNWVAAGRFVPVASSFAHNFHSGNPPPPGTPDHGAEGHLLFRWVAMEETTRMALEGAWHRPGAFAENLGRKALYTLGVFDAWMPGRGWSPLLVLTWCLALAGLLAEARSADRPDAARWLPAAFAASHFAAVTLIFPHAHGDRLILPFYVMLLPYVGPALMRCAGRLQPHGWSRAGSA